jgi:hypothetical protein
VSDENGHGAVGNPAFPHDLRHLIRDLRRPLPIGPDFESFALDSHRRTLTLVRRSATNGKF